MDTFFLEAPDVGRFNSLRIGHDNFGFGSAWHLLKVEVANTSTGEQVRWQTQNYRHSCCSLGCSLASHWQPGPEPPASPHTPDLQAVFPFSNWIDKEHGLSVLLTPDRDGDGKGDALVGTNFADYVITTFTSDVRSVGGELG